MTYAGPGAGRHARGDGRPDPPVVGGGTVAAVLALAACWLQAAACGGSSGPGADEPDLAPRSFRMGWFVNAPRPDERSLLTALDSMARVSEVALLQEPPPWPRLLAGEPVGEIADEKVQVAGLLRSRGLEVAYLADPLDGLDRTSETPALVAAGRSIAEPDVRALHEAWVREIARRVRPRWMGLASEINTLGQHGDPALYAELVEMIDGLAPEVRSLSPGTRVFVSFQVEDTHGLAVPADGEGFGLVDDFDVDFLGLSSYPVFFFETPADVPDDHLSAFRAVTDLPLAMVEGGWSSETVPLAEADPAEQAAFFRRYAELLEGVDARLWILLTYADLDLEALGLPPEREETLRNFARMGIVDQDFGKKPSFDVWEEIRARPLE